MAKYSDSQHEAIRKYREGKSTMTITVTAEEKDMILSNAEKAGKSIKQYIMDLVRAD